MTLFASWGHSAAHPSTILLAIYFALLGAVASVLLQLFVDAIRQSRRAGSESPGYKRYRLKGDWTAIWQSYVEGKEVINSEAVKIRQRRNLLALHNYSASAENPEGGYLWEGHVTLFDNHYILGYYVASERNVRSKGTLYLNLHNSGRIMEGQWVGCSFDGDLVSGMAVLARDSGEAEHRMTALLAHLEPQRRH